MQISVSVRRIRTYNKQKILKYVGVSVGDGGNGILASGGWCGSCSLKLGEADDILELKNRHGRELRFVDHRIHALFAAL